MKNLLFQRSGGYYLFWVSFVYFFAGMYNIFVYKFDTVGLLQIFWIAALTFPFIYPPFGRWLNMSVEWDLKMFNKKDKTPTNVVQFPEPKLVPPMPKVEPPPRPAPKTFYRFGVTDQQRISFSMGNMEITMNKEGCRQMIDQLTFFMNQLEEETDDE